MSVIFVKERGIRCFSGIAKLTIVLFSVAMATAFIESIWAVYMNQLIGKVSTISFLSAFFTILAFFSFFMIVPIVAKYRKSILAMYALFLTGMAYFLFSISKNLYFFIFLACFMSFLLSLRITVFGLIVRDRSSRKQISRNQGFVYSFLNLAWLIGPLVAGYLASWYGIPLVFILASVFVFFSLILFKIFKIDDGNTVKKVENPFRNFLNFFKKKERVMAYILRGGLVFWFILIYLYTPILIIRSGFGTIEVGYFLFAFSVPLIALEYLFSKITPKLGFRKMFKTAFLILAIIGIICFFVFESIYILLGLLVLSGIACAILEPMTEAYFFRVLGKKEELKYYGPYNTAAETSLIAAKILAGMLLLWLSFRFLFLFFAFFMFVYFLIASRMKEVKDKTRKNGK